MKTSRFWNAIPQIVRLVLIGFAACALSARADDSTNSITITCPSNIVQVADDGLCSAAVNYPLPSVVDTVPFLTPRLVCIPPPASSFPVGTNQVFCQATDAAGNTNSCMFLVIVQGTDLANFPCPADLVVRPLPGQTLATVNYPSLTVTGTCAPAVALYDPPSGSSFPLGTNSVTFLIADNTGQTNGCMFHVVVKPAYACGTITDLISTVQSLELNTATRNVLLRQLANVAKSLNHGKERTASAQLGQFMRKIIQLNLRRKNTIDDVTAESLIDCAQILRNSLGV